jgi:hypothetical protein
MQPDILKMVYESVDKKLQAVAGEVIKMTSDRFKTVEDRLEPVETFVKDFTPFDPSGLEAKVEERIEEVAKSIPEIPDIPEPFDPSGLEARIEERIEEVAKSIPEIPDIPEPFDPSGLEAKIEEVVKSIPEIPDIPEPFDPSGLEERIEEVAKSIPEIPDIPEPFDPSNLEERIEEVAKSIPEIPDIPEPFDPSGLEAKIEEVAKSIPKPFDPSGLEAKIVEEFDRKLVEIKESYAEELSNYKSMVEKLQKETESLRKKVDSPLEISFAKAKKYGEGPVAKGAVILHKNAVWVSRMDDNDTEPSHENKSYVCLIDAPKAPVHKGVYEAGKKYEFNDMVMWNNNTWIKTEHPSNEIPSEGWRLVAKAIRGKKGEKGDPGDTTVVDYEERLRALEDEFILSKVK